jgi:hypothetical protein
MGGIFAAFADTPNARQFTKDGVKTVAESAILNAKDYMLAPFAPSAGGDSGALCLATHKRDAGLQYVVKSGCFDEVPCNEFMYHHAAAALGLYTQEARLFTGIPNSSKRAVGIRYVPDARKFVLEEASGEDKSVSYKFTMLYVILNEEDSEELFYDGQGRVFKLDNAASFNLDTMVVGSVVKYGKKEPPYWLWQKLGKRLDFLEYEKYGAILEVMNEHHGKPAAETGFEFIRRFSELDLSLIEAACETLGKVYPPAITEYYLAFIERRADACKRFVAENKISQFVGKQAIKQNLKGDHPATQGLLQNLEKIHATELGIERIKRNLKLETGDVADWCRQRISKAEKIIRKGKNWYAHSGNAVITVNAHSYTIITAHINSWGNKR